MLPASGRGEMHEPVWILIGAGVGFISTVANWLLVRHIRRMDALEKERADAIKAGVDANTKTIYKHSDDIFAIQLWIRSTCRQYGFPDLFDKD